MAEPHSDHETRPAPAAASELVDGVVQLSFAVYEILGALAAELDLSISQVRMLGILRGREPGMLELARYLGLEKSSVTGLVDRAEQRGLVARARGGTDGRAVHVRLTPHAEDLARRFSDEVAKRVAALTSTLTEAESERLTTMLTRVVDEHAASKLLGGTPS